MHKKRLKGVGSFEDNLYDVIDSSKFLTEARNTKIRDENIFLDLKASIWIYDRSCWFLFRLFDHPIWIVILKKSSMDVLHFFSQDFGSSANTFAL